MAGSIVWFATTLLLSFHALGMLRLLTTEQLMGADEVLTQAQAWSIYDEWLSDERVLYLDKPLDLEKSFRDLTQLRRAAPKDWADSYLIAFAHSAGIRLVTFDKAIGHRSSDAILLPIPRTSPAGHALVWLT
jgi:uncharacterized protein